MTSWAKVLVVENLTNEEVEVLREAMFNVYFKAYSKRLKEGVSVWSIMEAASNAASGQLTVQQLDPAEANILDYAAKEHGVQLAVAPDRSSVSFLDGRSAIAAINSIAQHPEMYRMDVPGINNLLHKVWSYIGRSLGMAKPPQAKEHDMELGGKPGQVPPNLSHGGKHKLHPPDELQDYSDSWHNMRENFGSAGVGSGAEGGPEEGGDENV